MKTSRLIVVFLMIWALFSCKKTNQNFQFITIPNGNFENWANQSLPGWQTNSCPSCVPPFETYVVQKTTDAFNGEFAAKFIYNLVYKSWAYNKFMINSEPSMLTGYIKSNIASGDSVMIQVELYLGISKMDSVNWYGTSSIANYKKIEIPLSPSSSMPDSASIRIVGGGKEKTELYVDDLEFIKGN